MKRLSILLLFCALPAFAEDAQHKPAGPCDIRNVTCTADRIDFRTWYTVVIKNVAAGKTEWINRIPDFEKHASRKNNLELLTAAKLGLVKNPRVMLKILKPLDAKDLHGFAVFSTDMVCSSDFDWVTEDSYLRYYRAVHRSVQKLGKEGAYCLKMLEDTHDEIMADAARNPDSWGINSVPGY